MKHLVSLHFSSPRNNFETILNFNGQSYRISQYGANYHPDTMQFLMKKFDKKCDVIAISGFHPSVKIAGKNVFHPLTAKFLEVAKTMSTPTVTGQSFRDAATPWIVEEQVRQNRGLLENEAVAFLSGMAQQTFAVELSKYMRASYFFDPYLHFHLPMALCGIHQLETYARRIMPILKFKSLKQSTRSIDFREVFGNTAFMQAKDVQVIVATSALIDRISGSFLKDKVVIVDALTPSLRNHLQQLKVRHLVSLLPEMIDMPIPLSYALLEAFLCCIFGVKESWTTDEVKKLWDTSQHSRHLPKWNLEHPKRFGFIVHPLSFYDLTRHPLLRPMRYFSPPIKRRCEKMISALPGIRYGHIKGIKSAATGATCEGIIYTLFDTPKQLLSARPEEVYAKLLKVAKMAHMDGCKMLGLGAFTKVVGDGGVTVAKYSPIPVTTGNSLSAAATLWTARDAAFKLGLINPFDAQSLEKVGTAMVIGATGSIGKVCAKILAPMVKKLVISAPQSAKLMTVKDEIQATCRSAEIEMTTKPEVWAYECDLIVLSTSATSGGVLDILSLRPGAVVCDVSRPLTYKVEEAILRPDVLIIESGEILLPGDISLDCDIGLEEDIVYACLAETALLTLENRFESFTLSRDIDFHKVTEIYKMAKRHGAKLAEMAGPTGVITAHDIDLCRYHALRALKKDNRQL